MLRAYAGTFLSLAGVTCALTWVYLGMRSVMEIGGACAEGGPYEIAQPCPDGVPLLMIGGIFGGLICLGFFLWSASRLGPSYATLAGFAWPALFLSLGWNFLEFGVDPPGEDDDLVWGWLICALLFFGMGGVPLLYLMKPSTVRDMLWPRDPEPRPKRTRPPSIGIPLGESMTLGSSPPAPPRARQEPATAPRPPTAHAAAASDGDDVVERLERLAALRDRGALDAAEYEQAKKAVLGG